MKKIRQHVHCMVPAQINFIFLYPFVYTYVQKTINIGIS